MLIFSAKLNMQLGDGISKLPNLLEKVSDGRIDVSVLQFNSYRLILVFRSPRAYRSKSQVLGRSLVVHGAELVFHVAEEENPIINNHRRKSISIR